LDLKQGGVADSCGVCNGDNTSIYCKLSPAAIAGISAGAIAGIAVGAAAGAALVGVGGKKGFDFYTARNAAGGGVQDNPLYQSGGSGGNNAMYEGR
jgi:hypothetical protein